MWRGHGQGLTAGVRVGHTQCAPRALTSNFTFRSPRPPLFPRTDVCTVGYRALLGQQSGEEAAVTRARAPNSLVQEQICKIRDL